jgi:hypothetical protein
MNQDENNFDAMEARMNLLNLVDKVSSCLDSITELKTNERSDEQRKLAILYTKMEDCLAWAKYTVEDSY